MKEYGSFFELDLRNGTEWYSGADVKRLNTARCGIYYVLRLLNIKKILLPFYQCHTVRDFLIKHHIDILYTRLDEDLLPQVPAFVDSETAILVVNYFGLIPEKQLQHYADTYPHVIIDNSQAFYQKPLKNAYNIYSPRKFFGVPDGCYVVGKGVEKEPFSIPTDTSANTSLFLLERIEKGCTSAYTSRMTNESRLDSSNVRRMSGLTQALLKNVDYEMIKTKRRENFLYAQKAFAAINSLPLASNSLEEDAVPMVYPLLIEKESLQTILVNHGVFIGHWWSYLSSLVPAESIEMQLSRYMLPLPIDQRMRFFDIDWICSLIFYSL